MLRSYIPQDIEQRYKEKYESHIVKEYSGKPKHKKNFCDRVHVVVLGDNVRFSK